MLRHDAHQFCLAHLIRDAQYAIDAFARTSSLGHPGTMSIDFQFHAVGMLTPCVIGSNPDKSNPPIKILDGSHP